MSRPRSASLSRLLRPLAALFALALCYALILALRNGLADVYAEPAKTFLQDKRDAGAILTEAELQAINANLQKSLMFAPDNPLTLTELGRLHRVQLEIDTLDDAEIERHATLALDYYERAASLRPTWPWVWSNMAFVRYELYQDRSDAYHRALIHAARFGPWQGQVQRMIVDLSLDTWETLSPGARQAVMATVDRALLRQPAGIKALVDAAQGWPTFCRAVAPGALAGAQDGSVGQLLRLRRQCAESVPIDANS